MNVIDDLKNLSLHHKRMIQRAAGKLLTELPTTHTILINRKPGIEKARETSDFELIVLVNAESEAERERIVSESVYNNGSEALSENCEIYDPGFAYIRSEWAVAPDETEALTNKFTEVYEDTERAYLEFLPKHLNLFVKAGSMNVITINAPEMEKSDPLYYNLYIINKFDTGYMVYNRDIRSLITVHREW